MTPLDTILAEGLTELLESARISMSRPRVHPNGFVQLDVAPQTRLHFWPEDPHRFVTSAPHPIHDHVFDMESTVLKGCMEQTVFRVHLEHGAEPTHEVLIARYRTKSDSSLERSGVTVRVDELAEERFRVVEGETYTQPAFTFHTSAQIGQTVTLMTQKVKLPGTCRVLLPIGTEPFDEFDRHAWPDAELWAFIEETAR